MTSSYGIGQEAEQELAGILGERGYTVIPISAFTNNTGKGIKAPMIVVGGEYSVSPDLLAMKDGRSLWIEVKRKSVPAYFYKWHCWVHGIDRPNADDYRKAQESTGHPLFICVLEDKSPATPDLYLKWNDRSAHEYEKSDLTGPRKWLWITLDRAMECGAYFPGNAEMMGPRNPDGYGLYWARSEMKEFLR